MELSIKFIVICSIFIQIACSEDKIYKRPEDIREMECPPGSHWESKLDSCAFENDKCGGGKECVVNEKHYMYGCVCDENYCRSHTGRCIPIM